MNFMGCYENEKGNNLEFTKIFYTIVNASHIIKSQKILICKNNNKNNKNNNKNN